MKRISNTKGKKSAVAESEKGRGRIGDGTMKKFVCRFGMWMVVLALAAGIFYLFWGRNSQDKNQMGTLVKNMAQAAQSCKF